GDFGDRSAGNAEAARLRRKGRKMGSGAPEAGESGGAIVLRPAAEIGKRNGKQFGDPRRRSGLAHLRLSRRRSAVPSVDGLGGDKLPVGVGGVHIAREGP